MTKVLGCPSRTVQGLHTENASVDVLLSGLCISSPVETFTTEKSSATCEHSVGMLTAFSSECDALGVVLTFKDLLCAARDFRLPNVVSINVSGHKCAPRLPAGRACTMPFAAQASMYFLACACACCKIRKRSDASAGAQVWARLSWCGPTCKSFSCSRSAYNMAPCTCITCSHDGAALSRSRYACRLGLASLPLKGLPAGVAPVPRELPGCGLVLDRTHASWQQQHSVCASKNHNLMSSRLSIGCHWCRHGADQLHYELQQVRCADAPCLLPHRRL